MSQSPEPTAQSTPPAAAPAANRPADPRWPRAAEWLAAGPGSRTPDLAVLGVPTYATSLSGSGAHATPAAVRAALAKYSTWAASAGVDLAETIAPVDLGDVADPDEDPAGERRTTTAVADACRTAELVVLLGGDNALTAPALLGMAEAAPGGLDAAGLVTLDAHHDLRDGRSNGSPVRRLLDAGLTGERIAQVGIADWANSRSYAETARAAGITVIHRGQVPDAAASAREALDVAGAAGGAVYVDLDVDVCDRSVAPGCPASRPGGLSAGELLDAAYVAGLDPRVRVVDLTEVDATADPDGRTVRLAALCVLQLALGLAARSRA